MSNRNTLCAYVLAVTAATITFIIPIVIIGGFATTDLFIAYLSIIAWLVCFLFALIPYVFGIHIANRYSITHCFYFIAGGMLTAALLNLLITALTLNLGFNIEPPGDSFSSRYLGWFPLSISSGLVAGLVCWGYLSRSARRKDSTSIVVNSSCNPRF